MRLRREKKLHERLRWGKADNEHTGARSLAKTLLVVLLR
jgi:hypothetical protein